jgi:hypothetical protein
MDEAILAGRGGFQNRAELMREAVENLLNELDYPEAPAEPPPLGDARRSSSQAARLPLSLVQDVPRSPVGPSAAQAGDRMLDEVVADMPSWERDELTLGDLAATALVAPKTKPKILHGVGVHVAEEPLLGLHNRDYTSIWALHRMARYTNDDVITFEKYLREATRAAWYFGGQLKSLEERDRLSKLTVLFPTNTAKQPSAERGFQAFAVGSLNHSRETGLLNASGPLFAWRAIHVAPDGDRPATLTEDGWQLIRQLGGLSLELPHAPHLAKIFMSYLAERAPGDWWGFSHLLHAVSHRPTRDEVVERFHSHRPEWSEATASSIAQGYIARSREWGLVEPRLVDGRYWLTTTGRDLIQHNHPTHLVPGSN